MLISMDHGNKQCKLVRSEPFISGLSESEVRPFGPDVLKYGDKYYQISDQRLCPRHHPGAAGGGPAAGPLWSAKR